MIEYAMLESAGKRWAGESGEETLAFEHFEANV